MLALLKIFTIKIQSLTLSKITLHNATPFNIGCVTFNQAFSVTAKWGQVLESNLVNA